MALLSASSRAAARAGLRSAFTQVTGVARSTVANVTVSAAESSTAARASLTQLVSSRPSRPVMALRCVRMGHFHCVENVVFIVIGPYLLVVLHAWRANTATVRFACKIVFGKQRSDELRFSILHGCTDCNMLGH